jgi:hypothetical protein
VNHWQNFKAVSPRRPDGDGRECQECSEVKQQQEIYRWVVVAPTEQAVVRSAVEWLEPASSTQYKQQLAIEYASMERMEYSSIHREAYLQQQLSHLAQAYHQQYTAIHHQVRLETWRL